MPETCKRGHILTVENTYTRPSGVSECRACKRDAHRQWKTTHRPAVNRAEADRKRRRRAERRDNPGGTVAIAAAESLSDHGVTRISGWQEKGAKMTGHPDRPAGMVALRVCRGCGGGFTSSEARQKYCSPECRNRSYSRRRRPGAGEHQAVCARCGCSFGFVQVTKPRKYCPPCGVVRSTERVR